MSQTLSIYMWLLMACQVKQLSEKLERIEKALGLDEEKIVIEKNIDPILHSEKDEEVYFREVDEFERDPELDDAVNAYKKYIGFDVDYIVPKIVNDGYEYTVITDVCKITEDKIYILSKDDKIVGIY